MKKKLIALILAGTMILGTSLTVCAEDSVLNDASTAATGQEITGSSTINLPTIKVTVPTTADIIINPYQMEYKVGETPYTDQIISVEQEITNESNVAVAVNVSDLQTTTVSEGITISTAALSSKNTTKTALLYLEVQKSDGTFEGAFNAKSTNQIAIPNVAADTTGKTKAGAKDAIVTLEAGDQTPTKAKFEIGGSVVANPVDDEGKATPWTAADAIGISFKFTFTPQIVTTSTTTTTE